MKEKYKKENLQPIIKRSRNWTKVLIELGMTKYGNSRTTLMKYVNLHEIDISHFETTKERYLRVNREAGKLKRIPIEEILVENSTYHTNHLKNRLYDEGLKQPVCEECGQDEHWRGNHISMILDHINGINDDNRLENLRVLCPNCNAALPTHCRGSKFLEKQKKKLEYEKNKKEKYQSDCLSDSEIDSGINQRKIKRPPQEQLLREIKELGYCGTGRKYGVSDNSIRKWKKFYEKYGEH